LLNRACLNPLTVNAHHSMLNWSGPQNLPFPFLAMSPSSCIHPDVLSCPPIQHCPHLIVLVSLDPNDFHFNWESFDSAPALPHHVVIGCLDCRVFFCPQHFDGASTVETQDHLVFCHCVVITDLCHYCQHPNCSPYFSTAGVISSSLPGVLLHPNSLCLLWLP
jgi:hypothetical protein